jgi:putative acetyltransferase
MVNAKRIIMKIRKEQPGDESQIHEVNELAFERKEEADVVDVLRVSCPEGVSLVAEEDGRIVGHILFTPAVIEGEGVHLEGSGLAPMAVLPAYQGRGIGQAMIRAGLEVVRDQGTPFVIVVGHPWLYPKCGFERASKYGITCEYPDVPDDVHMIVVFDPERMRGVSGVAKERPEFAAAM